MRLLIGQIEYLNCQPFYPLLDRHRLIATLPADLGRLARHGEIDAGIIATTDYLQCKDHYEPIGGLGIANHEEVRSILLFSRKPITELAGAHVGITEETSTSARLLRVLLEVKDNIVPKKYIRGEQESLDAFLVIGNEALVRRHRPSPGFPYRYDLATIWWEWTGLPFVFAVWAIRRSLTTEVKEDFATLLEASFALGITQIDAIASRFAGDLGDAPALASFLRNFYFRLGPEEMKGLARFSEINEQHGLLAPI